MVGFVGVRLVSKRCSDAIPEYRLEPNPILWQNRVRAIDSFVGYVIVPLRAIIAVTHQGIPRWHKEHEDCSSSPKTAPEEVEGIFGKHGFSCFATCTPTVSFAWPSERIDFSANLTPSELPAQRKLYPLRPFLCSQAEGQIGILLPEQVSFTCLPMVDESSVQRQS
jgi:hypothetical protein